MYRRTVLAIGGICFSGCTTNSSRASEDQIYEENADVTITKELFDPEVIEIESDETVIWENKSTVYQTVTAHGETIPDHASYFASGDFPSEMLAQIVYPFRGGLHKDDQYRHTFEIEGEYEYYSIPQEHRHTGKVVVGSR